MKKLWEKVKKVAVKVVKWGTKLIATRPKIAVALAFSIGVAVAPIVRPIVTSCIKVAASVIGWIL
jgi:hypothetical protein